MQDVAPRAVRIADAIDAMICTIHFRVSFLVIVYLLPYTDYSMSPLPPVSPPVPLLNSLVLTSLDSPFLMAIAFTVVVSLRVKPPSYRVLCAVGVEPSVV
jgi:hypothetical protein